MTIGAEPVGVDSIPENGIYEPTTPKAEVRLPVHVPVDLLGYAPGLAGLCRVSSSKHVRGMRIPLSARP